MCLVWRRFEPLRYFPVNRADGVDSALAILGRQLIDDRSHPDARSGPALRLPCRGGLRPLPPIILAVAVEYRHAHVVSAGVILAGKGVPVSYPNQTMSMRATA